MREGMTVHLQLTKQPIMLRSVIGDRQFMVKWASKITIELLRGLMHLEEKRLVLQSIQPHTVFISDDASTLNFADLISLSKVGSQ
jgi:hypothetical protein